MNPNSTHSLALLLACAAAITSACSRASDDVSTARDERAAAARLAGDRLAGTAPNVIEPLQRIAGLDARIVALGRKLFHDPRLSSDGTISCASCHDIARGGDDDASVSRGVGGALGERNSPTVLNAALNFTQFWDGRADTLEEQLDGPITHPSEMNTTWEAVVEAVRADAQYVASFRDIYGRAPDAAGVRNALATFERSLTTPGSRFDRFLAGDATAIDDTEKRGYELFLDLGCTACHQGENVGGNLFQKFGIKENYFEDRGDVKPGDYGRFNITGKERDRYKFKVPTLRNVSRTAPYFHDGSVATLEEAIRIMARYQLGETIDDSEVADIAAFLRTLDGELP